MKVRWSDTAAQELKQIVRYIRRDSPQNALEFARRLLAKAATLRESPGIGRVIPEQEDPPPREHGSTFPSCSGQRWGSLAADWSDT